MSKDKKTPNTEVLLTFEEALNRYLDSLYGTAYEMTRSKQEAEDLVQEVCLKAYRKFYQLKSSKKAKSWLYSILTNTFINKYRKRMRTPPVVDVDVEKVFEESLIAYERSLKRSKFTFPETITDEKIDEALGELHVDLRTAVWLSDVEGFSYEEISEMLECPMGTVASRIHRARKHLREILSDYVSIYLGEKGSTNI